MTKKEKITRSIGLTFDFLRQVIKTPGIVEKIPNGSTLEFVEKDFPKLEIASKIGDTKNRKKKFLRVRSHLEVI